MPAVRTWSAIFQASDLWQRFPHDEAFAKWFSCPDPDWIERVFVHSMPPLSGDIFRSHGASYQQSRDRPTHRPNGPCNVRVRTYTSAAVSHTHTHARVHLATAAATARSSNQV